MECMEHRFTDISAVAVEAEIVLHGLPGETVDETEGDVSEMESKMYRDRMSPYKSTLSQIRGPNQKRSGMCKMCSIAKFSKVTAKDLNGNSRQNSYLALMTG